MRRQFRSALLFGLLTLAAGVFQDEVGHVDFHHSLVGIPQSEATFFHRPKAGEKASLLYTLSDLGVVGAINPSNGETVWRHQVSPESTTSAGYLRAPADEGWVAAARGPRVQAWNAITGRNAWQMEFTGEAKDLEVMDITETSRKDVLALFDEGGTTVLRRLHGGLGTVIWEFRETTKDVPLQVSTDISNVYIVSLHGSASSYSVKTTTINPGTGIRADSWTVGTKGDVTAPDDVMFVGGNSAAPIIAWRSKDKLSVQIMGTKTKHDIGLASDIDFIDIQAPYQTQAQTHFLVHTASKSGNRAEVFNIDIKAGQIRQTHELPFLPGRGSFSTSCDGANVYFTRISSDEIQVLPSDSHEGIARWSLKNTGGAVKPVHAVSEVIRKAGTNEYAVRAAILTEDHDWILVRNGEKEWARHEGLSGGIAAVWAEIPSQEDLAKLLTQEAHANPVSAYIHRLTRHIDDLKYLPAYLSSIPGNIVASLLGDTEETVSTGLTADVFGFNKIVVLVTRRGRFYGLNTGNKGAVLWNREVLPQRAGETLVVKGLAVTDESGLVAMRGSRGESVIIRASDGHIEDMNPSRSGKVSSTAIIDEESSAWLLALGPDGSPSDETLPGNLSRQTFIIRGADNTLKGIKINHDGKKITKQDVWEFKPVTGQRIVDVTTPPSHDPVASIGRVLGDRQVMYKYLNPNVAVVALIHDATSVLSVKLIDTISGQVLAAETHEGVDAAKSISCAMSENWYACTFFGRYKLDDASGRSIQGYQVVVSDLYESEDPNDRGALGGDEKFSSLAPIDNPSGASLPHVVSQSWVLSQPLTKLIVTQTRQGISNRNLVAYLPEAHSVVTLPRLILDPRRAVDRDPTAAEIEAEGLPKYAPAIEIDSRNIVSHDWEILGVEGFVASPAIVESTSLLVAYGIDVYGTRVVPSGLFDILGKGFNKLTLLTTVLALNAGVLFLAPMVRRSQINRKWEAFL